MGELDQGIVFSCARAEDYPTQAVYGLTITARCDVAQDKAKVYSYLPVVGLRDWWHQDGACLLFDRARRQLMGTLRGCLRECGFAESVLDVHEPHVVVDTLFQEAAGGRVAKVRARALAAAAGLNMIGTVGLPVSTQHLHQVCEQFAGLRRAVMDELLGGKLTGFYFLPQIEFGGRDDGFVVSLREVRHLPRHVAKGVANGLERPLDDAGLLQVSRYLAFHGEDFSMPIGVLPSPLIEQIMQSFSLLFSRVGTDDLPASYVSKLWDRLAIEKQAGS